MATGKVKVSTVYTKKPNIDFAVAVAKIHISSLAYSGKSTFAKLVKPDKPDPVDLLKRAMSQR